LKIAWKGVWNGGEVSVEVREIEELITLVSKLRSHKEEGGFAQAGQNDDSFEVPILTSSLGCSESVRQTLASDWGKAEPRTMPELQRVFKRNGIFFSRGTLSGVLNYMTKSGQVRRLYKQGKWAYVVTNERGKLLALPSTR
jgi:hypothetical protein